MGYVNGSKCERSRLLSCLHFERISDFLFCRVFCDGKVMMSNFFVGTKKAFFLMFCCRQALVLVSPR